MVAIQQASSVLKKMGLTVHVEFDGLKALQLLQRWRDEGINVGEKLLMMITDAEMPEMDGYRLTTEIRKDPALKALYIILHTSLSGSFNNAMAEKVGCDDFLSKFQPEALAQLVQERVRQRVSEKP
jgi:two-component system chemotaxis response regulator CheV